MRFLRVEEPGHGGQDVTACSVVKLETRRGPMDAKHVLVLVQIYAAWKPSL